MNRSATVAGTILLSLGFMTFSRPANAQTSPSDPPTVPVLTLNTTVLASMQPGDDAYLGSPYLNSTLGGVGPGFGVGLTVMTFRGFAATAEFSTARLRVMQSGRLLAGGRATGRLHDSLLSGLVGFGTSSRGLTQVVLGGLSWVMDAPSLDNRSIDQPYDEKGRLGFTGGWDVSQAVSRRVALGGNLRYSMVPRNAEAVRVGVGQHVFRLGAGLHIRLRQP